LHCDIALSAVRRPEDAAERHGAGGERRARRSRGSR
jgi:hypothetical protein